MSLSFYLRSTAYNKRIKITRWGVIRQYMNLRDLDETYLLSMAHNQENLYIEFLTLDNDGVKQKLFAHN